MACLPGMPCFGPMVRVVYPTTCDPYANRIVSSDFVEYNGDNLSCTGIQNCDTLTVALQKIDNKICSDQFVAQIIQTIETNEVLKAYFCQLVNECSPIPTTTTTTTAAPNGWNTSVGATAWDACNPSVPQIVTYSAPGDTPLANGMVIYSDINLTTPYNATPYITVGVTSFAVSEFGVLSNATLCNDVTTTTTTTTVSCATPTLNSATSDGFGNVTLNYDLNGSTLCTFVLAEYSDYPSFSPFSFSETIPDGCNQTSYILTLNTNSTQYVRVSMICDGATLNSNILSVVPGTTTTTTTLCTTGLESHTFMTQIHDFEGNLINILTTPIGDACALLPAIQTGSGSSFYTVYVDSLAVGQNVIYSYCTPVATGTYALADGPTGSINTFIAVVDGVITEIVNCGTFVTFNVNVGIDQPTACNPALSTPTYLFAASGFDIAGNTLYLDTALTTLAVDLIFNYGSSCYATNGSGVVSFVGPC